MYKLLILVTGFFFCNIAFSQEILDSEKAVEIALENNYGIKLARNAVAIAENNTSRYNTGELPSINLSGRSGYAARGSEIVYNYTTLAPSSIWVSQGIDVNASLNGNYLIYDFGNRELKKQRLKELLKLSELEERQAIENSIYTILANYYFISQIKENLMAQEEVLDISRDRKNRTEYQFQFGRSNRLAVLNAEVDLNRDSIDLLNLRQELSNEKRNLNFLLGRAPDTPFEIEAEIEFTAGLSLEQLIADALANNIELDIIEQDILLSQTDISINSKNLKPSINATAGIGILGTANNSRPAVKNQFASDFGLALSLNWNIFDGGYNKVRGNNLKIALENQHILREQKQSDIRLRIQNSWESYQTQLYLLEVESRNMETASLNFERTSDQFRLGQVSSVEFRQAQLNQLFARISFYRARLNAKINELNLLLLSGKILEAL